MKKLQQLLFRAGLPLLFLSVIVGLAACSSDDEPTVSGKYDSALVGSWKWYKLVSITTGEVDTEDPFTVTFNADGTGHSTDDGGADFQWHTENGNIYITQYNQNVSARYRFEGKDLVIRFTEDGETTDDYYRRL